MLVACALAGPALAHEWLDAQARDRWLSTVAGYIERSQVARGEDGARALLALGLEIERLRMALNDEIGRHAAVRDLALQVLRQELERKGIAFNRSSSGALLAPRSDELRRAEAAATDPVTRNRAAFHCLRLEFYPRFTPDPLLAQLPPGLAIEFAGRVRRIGPQGLAADEWEEALFLKAALHARFALRPLESGALAQEMRLAQEAFAALGATYPQSLYLPAARIYVDALEHKR